MGLCGKASLLLVAQQLIFPILHSPVAKKGH